MVDEVEEKVRDGNSCYDWRRGRREIENGGGGRERAGKILSRG